MDPLVFLLSVIDENIRERKLDDLSVPTWEHGQAIHTHLQRLQRGDPSGWVDFETLLQQTDELTSMVREILVEAEVFDREESAFHFPAEVGGLLSKQTRELQTLLNVEQRHDKRFANPYARDVNAEHGSYVDDKQKFIAPAGKSLGEVMYIEQKPGLNGPARIGRVRFSKSRKTLYYGDVILQSLKGSGYKANFYDVETGEHYWVSKCRRKGDDTLYPGVIEIDQDARDEYWTQVRKQPEKKHVTSFKSPGKYSKRKPR